MAEKPEEDPSLELKSVPSGEDSRKKVVQAKYADVTLSFMHQHDADVPIITPAQEKRLSRKVFLRVLGLTFLINLIMYMDKATLSYSSIMGLWEATGLDQNKYNNVNTVFYVGFAVGQIPGTYLLQRLPLSRMMFGITFLWLLVIFLHCAAFNYAGVIVLRFFLGLIEALAIPLMTTTNGMFLTQHDRHATQPVFYALCLSSSIPIGFIAYGVIYLNSAVGGWRILNIIIGGLTLLVSALVFFVYPDNPAEAKFLTTEEKVWVIRRVQESTNSTIEQKHFKREHMVEAFKDPVSWLFCGFFLLQQLANNLPYQQTLLYEEMGGISNLNSTLVTVAGLGYAVLWALFSFLVMHFFPNTSFLTIIWLTLPAWVGSVVAVSLDIKNSIGMLAAISLASQSFGVAWIIAFGLAATTAGSSYSKRLVRNAMIMASYSVANIISPQLWQAKDGPRYVPAWIVQIVLSFTVATALMAVAWYILAKRNKERLAHIAETEKVGVVTYENGDKVEVSVAALDLTDLEDKTFIYPL